MLEISCLAHGLLNRDLACLVFPDLTIEMLELSSLIHGPRNLVQVLACLVFPRVILLVVN
jgi:hypothetical protein